MANQIQHKAFITQFDEMTEGLIKAFVSVYGNVDSANEICDYGCFQESLDYKYPVFCLYHNWEMPVGKVMLAEEIPAGDERLPEDLLEYGGLYIEAQINLDKEMGRDAWSDIKLGVLDEYSIGYVVQEDFIDKEGYRHLTKVDLIEASPVVRAANRMTKTVEVKSESFEKETKENSQINTKQMKELLDQIQEFLAGVMTPIDNLTAELSSEGIIEDEGIAEPLAAMQEPLQAALGFLDELRINLAEMGYLDEEAPAEDAYDEEEEDKNEEEIVEAKTLDLEQVMALLSEITSLAQNAMSLEMEWEDKSIDDITEQIIGLMNVVQAEMDNPTGEVDLQAMVDAFAIVNTNVAELVAEAEAIDPELNPNVSDYIATVQNIGLIATQLTEIVMAEMEAPTEEAEQSTEEDSKAVGKSKVDLKEQIELEQLFNNYLQSQFNIN